MYAGYINVDKTNNRNLYYWFVESQGNPATDPVILWLNGGGTPWEHWELVGSGVCAALGFESGRNCPLPARRSRMQRPYNQAITKRTRPQRCRFPCVVRAGPGCSSLGGGLFSELGPWYPNVQGTLDPNPYAWNTVANVIFLGV